MGDADIELTILMPCLNEAETLAACVRQARQFLADHEVDGEVVVADNGSTDGSHEIAARRVRASCPCRSAATERRCSAASRRRAAAT